MSELMLPIFSVANSRWLISMISRSPLFCPGQTIYPSDCIKSDCIKFPDLEIGLLPLSIHSITSVLLGISAGGMVYERSA